VPPEHNGTQAAIVGEQPGVGEAEDGKPFVGPSGRLVNRALETAGLDRRRLHITNAVACYSPTKLSSKHYAKAAACCAPRLQQETAGYEKIITLGARPLQVFTRKTSVIEWFGYPLLDVTSSFGRKIFPHFHPAAALRAPPLLPVFTHIMRRAAAWVRGELPLWQWPDIHTEPTPEALAALRRIAQAPLLSYDVESAGTSPQFDKLLCVGVGTPQEAVSLEWPVRSRAHYEALVACLTGRAVKAAHNDQHDRLVLEAHGIDVAEPRIDTLLAHSSLYPQLRHGLSFVCAVEFAAPRWKSDFHGESEHKGAEMFARADPTVLRTYNARDCIMDALLAERQFRQLGREVRTWLQQSQQAPAQLLMS
jgi:uracil-DNA glycosylase family 4